MQEFKVVLTWEAIYDVSAITDYIEWDFGIDRANKFRIDIEKQFTDLGALYNAYSETGILYRGYMIKKKPFPPSIIFFIVENDEVHILRVLRQERDWQNIINAKIDYNYSN